MKWVQTLILGWILCWSGLSHAHSENPAARLMRARSRQEVDHIVASQTQVREARTACRIQLRAKFIPTACYETLALETQLGLHAIGVERRRLLAELDTACEQAANRREQARLAFSGAEQKLLSPTCRHLVRQGMQIQAYREHPRNVWSGN